MPTLQGQTVEDYLRCWDIYADAGIDLSTLPLVGVGSVCRRQNSDEIHDVLLALHDRDPEIPLHGYGVKSLGLKRYGGLLCSADSLAWSYNARCNPRLHGCTHTRCSNCLKWALRWRRNIVPGGCPDHGEPCDGTAGACWQQQLWDLRQRAGMRGVEHVLTANSDVGRR